MTKACPYIIGALGLVIAGLVFALHFAQKRADEHERTIQDITERVALQRQMDSLIVLGLQQETDEAMRRYRAEKAKNRKPTDINEIIQRASDSISDAPVDTLRRVLTRRPE